MKLRIKELLTAIAIPLAAGFVSYLFTQDSMMTFSLLQKPPLSPPGWLFPVVWTLLYVLMGFASWLIYVSPHADKEEKYQALFIYGLQLLFNFFWSIIFFQQNASLFAFIWLCVLLYLILLTALQFYQIKKIAAYLLIPYILWVTFAGYLNLTIYLLN